MNERGMNKNWNRGKRQQQQKDFKKSQNEKGMMEMINFSVIGVDRTARTFFNPIHTNWELKIYILSLHSRICICTADY